MEQCDALDESAMLARIPYCWGAIYWNMQRFVMRQTMDDGRAAMSSDLSKRDCNG